MTEHDPEMASINASNEFADNYIMEMEVPEDADHESVIFAMFVYTVHLLLAYGWTKEQLINEVHTHEAIATSDGSIQ